LPKLSQSEQTKAGAKSYRISFDAKALVKLAQATAAPIATLLTIPDAVALLPNSTSAIDWVLSVIGVWLAAAILWFVGFWGVLSILKIFSGDLVVNEDGLKLWRFGRIIHWGQIAAALIEPQEFFAKVCHLEPMPARLQIFLKKDSPGKAAKYKIQDIPSFLFAPDDFERLFHIIARKVFHTRPSANNVLIEDVAGSNAQAIKETYVQRRRLRLILNCLIAVSLTLFLGKKAAVNFIYASANKAFSSGNYSLSARRYEKALALDPSFAVAWNNLAGAEFRLNEIDAARKHWQLALQLKPDLVEAKISLAYLLMKQRQFAEAEDLLKRAIKLDPQSTEALINLAELNMRQGHVAQAIEYARQALTIDPSSNLAICLIAEGELNLNRPKQALTTLQKSDGHSAFCQLVAGQIYAAVDNLPLAESSFKRVLALSHDNHDALLSLATVKARENDFIEANKLVAKAIAQANEIDPWPYLIKANIEFLQGNALAAKANLACALEKPSQEANSLAYAADLSLRLRLAKLARQLANQALAKDKNSISAISTLNKLDSNR
jgi:tetratricopeptide (TPR) repeat protein